MNEHGSGNNVRVHSVAAANVPSDRMSWLLRGLVATGALFYWCPAGIMKQLLGAAELVLAVLLLVRILTKGGIAAESLLIVKELGVQLTRTYVNGKEENTFIDMERIRAVILNEGITMQRVVYYMAFVVEGEKNLVVAFKHLQPRLDVLEPIYASTLRMVFNSRPSGEELYHSPGERRRGR